MPNLTATKTMPAYNGMGVRIYINASDSVEFLVFDSLVVGQIVESPSTNQGYVESIDKYNGSFLVVPLMPSEPFSGGAPYKILENDIITIS